MEDRRGWTEPLRPNKPSPPGPWYLAAKEQPPEAIAAHPVAKQAPKRREFTAEELRQNRLDRECKEREKAESLLKRAKR